MSTGHRKVSKGSRTDHLASDLAPARPGDGQDMIRLVKVTKRYGDFTAVDGIDLTVPRGKIYGFLGPNGAGKTTTIRMISGVLLPTSGQILIGDHDLSAEPEMAKASLGYIPDRPYLYEKLSGREFLRFVAGLWGDEGKATEERAERLLDLFDLSHWKNELVESYSHGMRQKLLISSALIHQPELIVVDEPMVGLDPKSARTLKDLLRTYVDEGGTVFLSSHTLEVVEVLCDAIAIIHQGTIIAQGTMDELQSQADAGEAHLEEIFLKVTGGEDVADIVSSIQDGV